MDIYIIPLKEMDLTGLPFFTGIAIYCYEGAGMILSLEASIAKDYRSRFKVCLFSEFLFF